MLAVKRKRKKAIRTKKTEKAEKKEPASLELPVYDTEGKKISTLKLDKDIFGLKINNDLMHQVVTSQMANRRKTIAHTKDRSEVRGGGKKPWRQKGTGRARHGSIRSPLWKGGGVTFGPRKERIFEKDIPKKMRKLALFMALSSKAQNNFLILLDKLNLEQPKTKLAAEIVNNLRGKITDSKKGTILIALPAMDKNLILALRNLTDIKTIQAKDLNAMDLLNFKYLLMPVGSIKVVKDTFFK